MRLRIGFIGFVAMLGLLVSCGGDGLGHRHTSDTRHPVGEGEGEGDVVGEGEGDDGPTCAATPDRDGDGVGDSCDNCINTPNADQQRLNAGHVGVACATPAAPAPLLTMTEVEPNGFNDDVAPIFIGPPRPDIHIVATIADALDVDLYPIDTPRAGRVDVGFESTQLFEMCVTCGNDSTWRACSGGITEHNFRVASAMCGPSDGGTWLAVFPVSTNDDAPYDLTLHWSMRDGALRSHAGMPYLRALYEALRASSAHPAFGPTEDKLAAAVEMVDGALSVFGVTMPPISISESEGNNAHASSDGTITVGTQLINSTDTSTLAQVIAHEVGHIDDGHVGLANSIFEALYQEGLIPQDVYNESSRNDERAADAYAAVVAWMNGEENPSMSNWLDGLNLPETDSHPSSAERSANITAIVQALDAALDAAFFEALWSDEVAQQEVPEAGEFDNAELGAESFALAFDADALADADGDGNTGDGDLGLGDDAGGTSSDDGGFSEVGDGASGGDGDGGGGCGGSCGGSCGGACGGCGGGCG